MKVNNSKQILSNLYGLLMEINLYRTDEDVLSELQDNPDDSIDEHLLKIKQINAKLRGNENRLRFEKAIEQIRLLKEKGLDELEKLIKPEEKLELIPLFRKFEELSEDDERAILDDKELLLFLKILNDRIDENSKR